ncbi:hypothetical protein BC830DRAFT_720908 [Chytriomyces sp. MP71]|nr:hypothetical protein BC830DRAFT_720908 [Chytriomyces sp. MP71]
MTNTIKIVLVVLTAFIQVSEACLGCLALGVSALLGVKKSLSGGFSSGQHSNYCCGSSFGANVAFGGSIGIAGSIGSGSIGSGGYGHVGGGGYGQRFDSNFYGSKCFGNFYGGYYRAAGVDNATQVVLESTHIIDEIAQLNATLNAKSSTEEVTKSINSIAAENDVTPLYVEKIAGGVVEALAASNQTSGEIVDARVSGSASIAAPEVRVAAAGTKSNHVYSAGAARPPFIL